MLDILQLHQQEDNRDARCWILARGKKLRKELDLVQNQLFKKMNENDLISLIAENAGVQLKVKLNDKSVGEYLTQIIELRKRKDIGRYKIERLTGTSGIDWTRIQQGKHLPSCKKLRKIIQIIDLNIVSVCKKNDFCLRSIDLIARSFDSKWVPLVVISSLLETIKIKNDISEKEFQVLKEKILNSIDQLRVMQDNSKPIKAVKEIDKNLAKILGAFAADGNYYPPDMLRWEDEYQEQLELLSKWLNDSFGIRLKIEASKRDRNSFTIKFRNKIIGRYLEVFFDYKPGNKTYFVSEPSLIKKQNFEIRKAFANGALTFDGSANADGTIGFGVVSKEFRDDVAEILQKDGIILCKPKIPDKNKWYFCTSRKLDISQLNKLAKYFDRGIKKRRIIEFYLGNVDINLNELKELFPKIKNEINPSNLLNFLDKTHDVYELMKDTNLSRQTLLRYLRILEQAKLIKSQLIKQKRFYSPNN
jgi:transcriptional regulator with XRE-family HTH domain/DNA-binding transcriptional ArsR family regulator